MLMSQTVTEKQSHGTLQLIISLGARPRKNIFLGSRGTAQCECDLC